MTGNSTLRLSSFTIHNGFLYATQLIQILPQKLMVQLGNSK